MTCRICLRLGILVLLTNLCSSHLLLAQSQACADSASPPPAPVQETKISIVDVEFQGENPLSDALRAKLAKNIKQNHRWVTRQESDSSWIDGAIYPIREALNNQGYFKASVEGTPYLVRALPAERLYVLSVVVESGPKFKLGKIRFASASETPLVFPEALLRQQVPMQEGEVFNVSKIREGLEAIGRLYGSKGYIDATPEPDTTIDESDLLIDMLIKVDEQKPYRISKIEVLGLGPAAQKYLRIPQETGDVFNSILWRNFFKDNGPHLPADASQDKNLRMRKNVGNATMDVTFDFRPCPKTESLDESEPPL
jgi:outer membrane protein assembly factor BamA